MLPKAFAYPMPALRWLIALALLGAPGGARAQTPAAAQDRPDITEAESYAARAFEAYRAKDYGGAVALYQQAYALAASADALYNIARVYDLGLRDRPLAINAYRRFLSDPGASPDRIRAVNERLSLLREAEQAQIEGGPAAPTAAARPATGTSEPRATSGWSTLQALGFSSGALGVISCGVGVGFGISMLHEANTANGQCTGNRCASQRGVDAAHAAATRATIATASLSAGAALMLAGTALWFIGSRDSEASDAHAAADLSVTPVASSGELGMALSGSW